MTPPQADIAVIGAGIAGLWIFNRLKRAGYDAVLLEPRGIGGGQSIASQGIIHSGLKYALAGKVNDLAKSISAMPDLWHDALAGRGPVDLSMARMNSSSQYLLIPAGFMGGLVKLVAQKTLGGSVKDIARADWPATLKTSGFEGSLIYMDEPVLDIPSVIRALAEPYKNCIRKGDASAIDANTYIYTAAAGNLPAAHANHHDKGLETQARPLLMGMLKNAPFELYAHLVGASEKPVATITTHKTQDGALAWYIGGGVAERAKDSPQQDLYDATLKALHKYMPGLALSGIEWASLPIDRIEGKSSMQGWMPDTPVIHEAGNHLYCWPTKLTFAPLLSDMIMERLKIEPSHASSDFSSLPAAEYAQTPWDKAQWIKTQS